jgi:hypothetical protein
LQKKRAQTTEYRLHFVIIVSQRGTKEPLCTSMSNT